MFEYMICNQVDEDIYYRQCDALEKHIPQLEKKEELVDVDESKFQRYSLADKNITVLNSFYLNGVFVRSEIELEQYFK